MSQTLQTELTSLVAAGVRTDYSIAPRWVWGAVAGFVIWAAIPVIVYLYSGQTAIPLAISLGILGLSGLFASATSSYLVYQIINRRNLHFSRTEELFWKMLEMHKSKAQPSDMKIQLPIASTEQDLRQLAGTPERSAVLWGLLTLIPYLGWLALIYVLAFLSRDLAIHERWEDLTIEDLARVQVALGVMVVPRRQWHMPRQSVPAYVIFSFITLGIFSIVWLYFTVTDPKIHFEYHRTFESTFATGQSAQGQVVGVS